MSDHWAEGGAGAIDLAHAVDDACQKARASSSGFKYLYPLDIPIK